jgi:hypothetical protein
MAISAATLTRLEKAAIDSGFDRELAPDGDWLRYASTHAPLQVWLSVGEGGMLAGLSHSNVARALEEHGTQIESAPPAGALAIRIVPDVPSLHRLLRRAYQLSRSLPDALLTAFQKKAAVLPKSTEAERLVVQRVGQDLFRVGLLEYWDGRCAITGLHVPELLRASHIKPWADCDSDGERLDVFNGLLLAPHLDAVFDRGFITVADSGAIVVSAGLASDDRVLLGLAAPLRVGRIADEHRKYLSWHRERVFKGGG